MIDPKAIKKALMTAKGIMQDTSSSGLQIRDPHVINPDRMSKGGVPKAEESSPISVPMNRMLLGYNLLHPSFKKIAADVEREHGVSTNEHELKSRLQAHPDFKSAWTAQEVDKLNSMGKKGPAKLYQALSDHGYGVTVHHSKALGSISTYLKASHPKTMKQATIRMSDHPPEDRYGGYSANMINVRPQNWKKAFDQAHQILSDSDSDENSEETDITKAEGGEVDDWDEHMRRDSNLGHFLRYSKVRDESGDHKMLYHATPKDFHTFAPGGGDDPKKWQSGPAVWMSPYKDHYPAAHNVGGRKNEHGIPQYKTGTHVMPLWANIKNPLVLDSPEMLEWAARAYAGVDNPHNSQFPLMIDQHVRDALIADGYDGIFHGGSRTRPNYKGPGHLPYTLGEDPAKEEEVIAFHPHQLKSAIGNNGDFDPSKPEIHKAEGGEVDRDLPPLSFDPEEGAGAVPYNKNIDYMGMVRHMPVSEFLDMAYPLHSPDQESLDFLKDHLRKGRSFGQPFLNADWNEDQKQWDVKGHEGRHRSKAISELYGPHTQIPVHVFPYGMRARDITDEMRNAPFVSEQHVRNRAENKKLRKLYEEMGKPVPSFALKPEKSTGGTVDRDAKEPDFTPPKLQGTQIMKEPGGNWLSGSVENSLEPLKKETIPTYLGTHETPEVAKEIAERGIANIGNHPEAARAARMEGLTDTLNKANQTKAVNDFINKQLTRYVKNEMGTERDPVRALAERGILHYAPDNQHYDRHYETVRKREGYPETRGKSDLAKAWENASDKSIGRSFRAEELLKPSGYSNMPLWTDYENFGEKHPWLKKVDPSEKIYGATSDLESGSIDHGLLGFDHLIDELHNAVNPESDLPDNFKLRHESLARMSVPQAVEHVHNINEWRKKNREDASRKKAFNPATYLHKDYPGTHYAWYELKTSPNATPAIPPKYEKGKHLVHGAFPAKFDTQEEAQNYIDTFNDQLREKNKNGDFDPLIKEIKQFPLRYGGQEDVMVSPGQEAKDPDLREALSYEGNVMGHCVGGYSSNVTGGHSRIFSLRNKKTGEPHVTVETHPKSNFDFDEFNKRHDELGTDENERMSELHSLGVVDDEGNPSPDDIAQIKGKANGKPVARYMPYVQDFVKSGKWGDVSDLHNADLIDARHWPSLKLYKPILEKMRENGETLPDFLTKEENEAFHKKYAPEKANGGAIIAKATGGVVDPQKAIRRAVMVAEGMKRGGYKDPKTSAIEDWKWRPLKDVQAQLGDTKEIPSHVATFGRFMDDTANKAGTVGLTPRDLIKAYTITRASIQRGAVDSDKVRAAGLALPNHNEPKVRPEGAFGEWLHTPMGQRYLQHAERGIIDPHSISNAVQIMAPFGRHTTDIPDALQWAAKNLPGREGDVSRLVAQAQQGTSSPSEWRDFIQGVRGVGPSKAGFIASLLGRGDQPTLDARQIVLHTGNPSKQAAPYIARRSGLGGAEAVERLAARQRAMNLTTPEGLAPYYQHLAHHTIWDAVGNDQTTHSDVIHAMQHAATGGKIKDNPLIDHPLVHVMRAAGIPFSSEEKYARGGAPKKKKVVPADEASSVQVDRPIYSSWDEVPTINPQDLVGKRIFPIRADLLKTGPDYTGIDSSQLTKPVAMRGGPGFPLIEENQRGGMGWAIKGKGRGTFKLNKNADYAAVTAMMPNTHESNSSFARALIGTMAAHARDKRIPKENLDQIDALIRAQSKNKKLSVLQDFPGFAHQNIHNYVDSLNFESRDRISKILHSARAQKLGAPSVKKIARETIDPRFSGLNRGDVMYLLELEKGDKGVADLVKSGFTPHESYPLGIRGRIVGKFHHPFAAETLWKDWFDQKRAAKKASGKSSNPAADTAQILRGFDLALPTTTVTQAIADNLPSHPMDVQSPQAARMALDVAHDRWTNTETPVGHGGVSPAEMSKALKNSEASSTLTQYSEKEIKDMVKKKKFRAFKLPSGDVYFGLKHGTNYEEEYGFKHPELTPNETALVSVVNNEPGAKGVGGASVMLKAIKEGATALDAYAVPSKKHPDGFLPSFYRQFGFKELGRIPFDPQYSTDQQLEDLKHYWRSTGWDESMGMPSVSIMKWDGKDEDRQDALRKYLAQSRAGSRPGDGKSDVRSASGAPEQGTQLSGGEAPVSGQGDGRGNRGGVRDDSQARPADRFTRTLTGVMNMTPQQAQAYGVSPEDVSAARNKLMPKAGGGLVDHALRMVTHLTKPKAR